MTTVNHIDTGGTGGEAVLHERITTMQQDHNELKSSIERQFSSVHSAISAIATEIKDRSKLNWQPISVLLSFVTVVGGLVYWPIKDKQEVQTRAIEMLGANSATRSEVVAAITAEDRVVMSTISSIKERRDDQQRTTEARFARLESDVDKLQAGIVPRGEHEAHWAEQRDRDATMQREIETARNARIR